MICQRLKSYHQDSYSSFPSCSKHEHPFVTSSTTSPKWFTAVDLCSVIFSIPVDPNSQYQFAFIINKISWTVMPEGFH